MMCMKHNVATFGTDARKGDVCLVCELKTALQVLQQHYDTLRSERDELTNLVNDLRTAPAQKELEDSRVLASDYDTARLCAIKRQLELQNDIADLRIENLALRHELDRVLAQAV